MRREMLAGLSTSTSADWLVIPDIDIDASWLEFGDVYDVLLEGIGDVVAAIFDGL